MKLFNFRKRQTNSQLPEEVQNFTAAEQRERTSLAWVVGIVSLIVVVLILLGLFFAGRWVYNTLTDSDEDNSATTSEITTDSKESDKDKASSDDKAKTDSDQNGSAGDQSNSDDSATGRTTPATGPTEPEDLPRTGPDLDL